MLGEALRFIRVFHDLKQSEAATKLGVSKSYISEIESGTKPPTLLLIQKYADTFEIPVSSIIFFSESLEKDEKPSYVRAKTFVASKILNIMKFLEEKSGQKYDS